MKRSKPILSSLLLRLLRPYMLGVVADVDEEQAHGQDEDATQEEQDDPDVDTADDSEDDDGAGEDDQDGDAAGGPDDEDAELVVSLGEGDQEDPEDAEAEKSPVIRDLRKAYKAVVRERNQLREQQRQQQTTQPAAVTSDVGPEPTLEDSDVDYDPEKFKVKYSSWLKNKTAIERQKEEAESQRQQQAQQWQATVDSYKTASSKLKVRDFDLAESAAAEHLDVTQQGIILHMLAPERAALVMYAVGRNPKVAKELASVKDPMKFAYAVSKLELTQLKTTNKKAAPPPAERALRSTTTAAAAVDKQLDRLQKEADRTGDRTKVAAYLRSKQRSA